MKKSMNGRKLRRDYQRFGRYGKSAGLTKKQQSQVNRKATKELAIDVALAYVAYVLA